jgi:hypothetical protein
MKNKLLSTLLVALITGSTLQGMEQLYQRFVKPAQERIQEYLYKPETEEKESYLEKKISLEGSRANKIIEAYKPMIKEYEGLSEEEKEKSTIYSDEQFTKAINLLNRLNNDLDLLYRAFIYRLIIEYKRLGNVEIPRYVMSGDIFPLYDYKNFIENKVIKFISQSEKKKLPDIDSLKAQIKSDYKEISKKTLNIPALEKENKIENLEEKRKIIYSLFNNIQTLKKLLEPNDFQEFIFEILDVRSEMQFNREITVLKSYLTAVENRREKLIEEKSQKEKELEEKRIAAEEEEALKKRPRKIINLEEAIKREKERKERLEAREAEKERLIKKAKEIEAAEREELYGLKEVD